MWDMNSKNNKDNENNKDNKSIEKNTNDSDTDINKYFRFLCLRYYCLLRFVNEHF